MKLTGELKDKVDKTESMVEKKDIITEAGMELDDNELEGVAGGVGLPGTEFSAEWLEEQIRKTIEQGKEKYKPM